MHFLAPILIITVSSALPALAFIGLGIEMYNPPCAHACGRLISPVTLSCTDLDGDHAHMGHGAGPTTPECKAGDTPFLTTLAYCINTTCADYDVKVWELEKYWSIKATGDESVQPKWTYMEAYNQVTTPPEQEFDAAATLNATVLVPADSVESMRQTLLHFEAQETNHSIYGLTLLIVGFGTPILLTLLGYLPYMGGVYDKLRLMFVYPSTIGTYHVRELPYSIGNAPLVGQALYVFMFTVLNIVLTAVNYNSTQPNMWFASTWEEVMGYVSCRTGVLAFALAPLTILFSGRNNVLLWLTNWSHSTFMVLHRWVARLFVVQVVLHSIVELALYVERGSFNEEVVKEYWIWGCVATLACCIMVVISVVFFRKLAYETFLILHILLAAFTLIGSWYHVEYLFTRQWGYELWLYAACAVWFFDRLIRVLRVAKVGMRRSQITELGGDIVRIDVPGIRWSTEPGMNAYIYLPSLKPWAPWENHPFSIIPTQMLHSYQPESPPVKGERHSASSDSDVEKTGARAGVSCSTTAGVTMYVKKANGITKNLRTTSGLLTLLEGPYHNSPTSSVLKCDRLVLVAGGIGITGVLGFTRAHPNAKLYWSMKKHAEPLAEDLDVMLRSVEKDVKIGDRFDVPSILEQEAASGWETVGVVVCGPGTLCDEARAEVIRVGKASSRTRFVLEVEAFSW